jgi:predicted ester cyclase
LADYKQWATGLLTGLTGFHVAADDLVAEEGKAVKRWTATGVHEHALGGIPPTGKRVSFSGVSIYRVAGGRIEESWYVYDFLGLLQQLGVIPVSK